MNMQTFPRSILSVHSIQCPSPQLHSIKTYHNRRRFLVLFACMDSFVSKQLLSLDLILHTLRDIRNQVSQERSNHEDEMLKKNDTKVQKLNIFVLSFLS